MCTIFRANGILIHRSFENMQNLSLAAAQIRFRLETLTATEARTKEDVDQGDSGKDSCLPLLFVPPVACVGSKEPNLANENCTRELADWKEKYEKASHVIRRKDQQLKSSADEIVKIQQLSNDLKRDLKKCISDSKSNERFLKCVQAEYELLRSTSGRSNDAVNDMKEEASRLTKANEELTRIVHAQGHEIKLKIEEWNKQCRDKKTLERSVVKHLETATLATGKADKVALLIDTVEERNQRLEQRSANLLADLQHERNLNRSYRDAASEAETAASSASQALVDAATLHSVLLERLNDRDREIASLKVALESSGQRHAADLAAQSDSRVRSYASRSDETGDGISKRARCDIRDNFTTSPEAFAPPPAASRLRETFDRESGGIAGNESRSIPTSVQALTPATAVGDQQCAVAGGQSRPTPLVSLTDSDGGSSCPICLESPYGLMQSCAKCKTCMHSSCVRRHLKSGTEQGALLLCPKCRLEM